MEKEPLVASLKGQRRSYTCISDLTRNEEENSLSSENADKKTQNSIVTIFAVWNTIMGSSLLTVAWGVERAGLGSGLFLLILMGAMCLYTAYILLRVRVHHGVSPHWEVADLCRILLGRTAEIIAHGFSLMVMLGANIIYWILMTNFLFYTVNFIKDTIETSNSTTLGNSSVVCPKAQLFINSSVITPAIIADDTDFWGLHSTVPIYIALIIYPLLNFSNVTFFTKFNSLGTLSVVYLLIFVVTKGISWGVNMANWVGEFTFSKNAAALSGMLALSFYIHNIIITIMSNNRHQEKNGRDLSIAFVLVTFTYILVGATYYVCFPLAKYCIEDNILNNFGMRDTMTAIARVLLLFQVITVYPLICYMFRTQTLHILPIRDKENKFCILLLNAIIVIVCILFACFCPNIGTIIRYTGAVSGLVHIFTLPCLLQVRSLHLRGKLTIWKCFFYFSIFLFGAVNLCSQFFIDE